MNVQPLASGAVSQQVSAYLPEHRSSGCSGHRNLFQLDLFDSPSNDPPQAEHAEACAGIVTYPASDNYRVQAAIDAGWWNDANALAGYKLDLRRDLGQMVALHGVNGAQYPEEESEIRNACRTIAARISELENESE